MLFCSMPKMTLLLNLYPATGRERRDGNSNSRHGKHLGPSHVALFFFFFLTLPSWKTQDVSLNSLSLSLSLSVFVYFGLLFLISREVCLMDTSCSFQQNFVNWHCLQSVSCVSSIKKLVWHCIPSGRPIAASGCWVEWEAAEEESQRTSRNPPPVPLCTCPFPPKPGCYEALNLVSGFSC